MIEEISNFVENILKTRETLTFNWD